jgi:hypothetical protein
VVEAEAAQRLRDPRSVPANRLMPAGREGREKIKFHLPHLQARGCFHQSVLANLLARICQHFCSNTGGNLGDGDDI